MQWKQCVTVRRSSNAQQRYAMLSSTERRIIISRYERWHTRTRRKAQAARNNERRQERISGGAREANPFEDELRVENEQKGLSDSR